MEPGDILNNRYNVEALLAEGGMARVYRARDQLLDRPVAVKVLRDQFAADGAFVERFDQEARAAAGMSHPNIVAVYDVGTEQDRHFIVMELVDGENLKQIIQRKGALGPERAIDLAQQVLAAVGFAHQRGIVHRDIKPQNVLVDARGHVKVVDFGIARAAGASSQMTETGIVMGSVHYCAPEQAMGKGATQAADLYSAGVVLYEMLSGQVPFDSDNALGVALKHVQESPPPLHDRNLQVSPTLERIVFRAMAKDPEQRFASADDMGQALRQYRQMGEQETAPFAAVAAPSLADQPVPSGRAALPVYRPAPLKAAPAKRRTLDWLVVVFSLLILAMVAGWLPIAARLYDLYIRPLPSGTPQTRQIAPQPTLQAGGTTIASAAATPVVTGTGLAGTGTARIVTVPMVVALQSAVAQRDLERAGLGVNITEDYSERYPEGAVITQTIPAGDQVPAGTAVGVVVSKGTRLVLVPDVLNRLLEDAKSALAQLGLRATSTTEASELIARGRVIDQSPLPGTAVTGGSVVSLVVSNGPSATPIPRATRSVPTPIPIPTTGNSNNNNQRPIVPNLVGMSETDARAAILAAYLDTTYSNYQEVSDIDPANRDFFLSIPVGSVVSQNPRPGSVVAAGTTVYIAVRKN